jgi:hypothetical protein
VNKYILKKSLSSQQRLFRNQHHLTTASVCEKAARLNRTEEEREALLRRIKYELRWALLTESWEAAARFLTLQKAIKTQRSISLMPMILRLKPRWYWFWKIFI